MFKNFFYLQSLSELKEDLGKDLNRGYMSKLQISSTYSCQHWKRRKLIFHSFALALLIIFNKCSIISCLCLLSSSSLNNNNKFLTMKSSRIYLPPIRSLEKSSTCNKYARTMSLFRWNGSQKYFCQSSFLGGLNSITNSSTSQSSTSATAQMRFTQSNIIKPLQLEESNNSNLSTDATQISSIKPHEEEDEEEQLQSDHFETIFTLDLPEGKCVGLRLSTQYQNSAISTSLSPYQLEFNDNHWIKKMLHPKEVKFGIELPSEGARLTFFIGRLAMRTALMLVSGCNTCPGVVGDNDAMNQCNNVDIGYEDRKFGGFIKLPAVSNMDHSILKDQHGRPQVPHGYIGSISHKKTTGVALVSNVLEDQSSSSTPKIGIGVDIEQSFSRRRSIAKKILTSNELESLGQIKGVTKDEEVLLRFSLKESVYKAMHPLISQWVGFQEAEIEPHHDGTATVKLNLKSGAHKRFKSVKAHWRRIDGDFFLTSSSVTMID